MIPKVHFLGEECTVRFDRYRSNDRIAIVLVCEDGEIMAKATANIDAPLSEDEVAIKNFSENEGMLQTLVTARIVSPPVRFERSGHVLIPICRILVDVEGCA